MMKSFKQFLKAKTAKVPIADYYPSHGVHSQEKKKIPMADYTPSHGKHSVQEEANSPKTMSHEEFTSYNPNSKIHPTVTGVHDHLEPSKEKWDKALKPHEKDAVNDYTGSSVATNRELIDTAHGRPSNFEHHPDDDTWTKDWKDGNKTRHAKMVTGLDSLLNRSKVPRNLTVYHGINAPSSVKFNPGEVASQHPDRHVRMPAYLSTTIDSHVASSFARPEKWEGTTKKPTITHMLRIHLKRGQKGFKYVGNRSSIAGEREGILKRDSVLKIGEHPTVVHHTETGGHIHVWDAHLVDHQKD
jgi:hypothetical protein